MENNTVTVSKFSKISKIPKATIYTLIAKEEYQKYVIETNGIKRISLELLEVLDKSNIEDFQETKEQGKEVKKPLSNDTEIDRLRKEVQELKETISEKDKQIIELASKFAELASQAQVIAGQAQVLQLSEKNDVRGLQVGEEETIQEQQQKKQGFFKRLFGK